MVSLAAAETFKFFFVVSVESKNSPLQLSFQPKFVVRRH